MLTQKLDNLARSIDSPRRKGRLDAIKRAFAEFTEEYHKPWWKRELKRWKPTFINHGPRK